MSNGSAYPVTPDGRYFVVRGRLWRMSNPSLDPDVRLEFVNQLMSARRAVGSALKSRDRKAEIEARRHVDAAKRALGERGELWWSDGAPDYNRQLAKNTPYAGWHSNIVAT